MNENSKVKEMVKNKPIPKNGVATPENDSEQSIQINNELEENVWEWFPQESDGKIEYLYRFLEPIAQCEEPFDNKKFEEILSEFVRAEKNHLLVTLLVYRIRELDRYARLSNQFMHEANDEVSRLGEGIHKLINYRSICPEEPR